MLTLWILSIIATILIVMPFTVVSAIHCYDKLECIRGSGFIVFLIALCFASIPTACFVGILKWRESVKHAHIESGKCQQCIYEQIGYDYKGKPIFEFHHCDHMWNDQLNRKE